MAAITMSLLTSNSLMSRNFLLGRGALVSRGASISRNFLLGRNSLVSRGALQSLHSLSFLPNPGTCVLCDTSSGRQLDLCPGCEADLPWVLASDAPCRYCGEPDTTTGICHQCQIHRPANDGFATAFRYEFPIDIMVQGFKTGQLAFGRVLAQLLASRTALQATSLVPVPLARKRKRQRGFNQAQVIASVLAQHHSVPLLDIVSAAPTSEQKALSAKQRQRNVKGAFSITDAMPLNGRHLTVIDDVYTTGATTRELALTLKRQGAAAVNILTLARTPIHNSP
ncbi:MAG: double zinc ribbon domain-containing protein [Pseudomonadales bacterium]